MSLRYNIPIMQTIYLIRHGEKEHTVGDPGLTDLGHEQAQSTATYLTQFPITQIVTSPLKRSRETASVIAHVIGKKAIIDPLLRERDNWGDNPGQSFPEFLHNWHWGSAHREEQPKTGDSSRQAGERLEEAITKYKKAKHLVLVCHGGIISDFLRNTFSEELLETHLPDFAHLLGESIKVCSITIVEKTSNNYELKVLASLIHL